MYFWRKSEISDGRYIWHLEKSLVSQLIHKIVWQTLVWGVPLYYTQRPPHLFPALSGTLNKPAKLQPILPLILPTVGSVLRWLILHLSLVGRFVHTTWLTFWGKSISAHAVLPLLTPSPMWTELYARFSKILEDFVKTSTDYSLIPLVYRKPKTIHVT